MTDGRATKTEGPEPAAAVFELPSDMNAAAFRWVLSVSACRFRGEHAGAFGTWVEAGAARPDGTQLGAIARNETADRRRDGTVRGAALFSVEVSPAVNPKTKRWELRSVCRNLAPFPAETRWTLNFQLTEIA